MIALGGEGMKVGEVIDRLNNKESLAILAKQLGITPYTLSKKLRLLGYEYDSERKRRVYVGEGEEPRDWKISDVSSNMMAKENINYQKLMYEELRQIRLLLTKKEQQPVFYTDKESIRMRRTFSICENILQKLDETAKQTGWQKSRIIEAALKEWLEKF
jgi:hypothetical protein